MIKEVDVDGDGRIDFYEFVHALGEPEITSDDDDDFDDYDEYDEDDFEDENNHRRGTNADVVDENDIIETEKSIQISIPQALSVSSNIQKINDE